jgi:hypothetical protein
VVLRFGAHATDAQVSLRLTPEGEPIKGRGTMDPELARPRIMEGKFFE